ncbi:MAG: hypothetical protein LBV38_00850 [Alistipes sp.]|jgi:hypothetical protein|nr:hypothetical protein [Alistipes sp.]
MNELEGKQASLKTPYSGYQNITLVKKSGDKWLVELCGSGKRIEVYEDEFTID